MGNAAFSQAKRDHQQAADQMYSLVDIVRRLQKMNPAFGMRLAEAEALGRWGMAVGESIARHSRAIRVQDSVLWVEVDHPIWKSELHYRKRKILDVLNGNAEPPYAQLSMPKQVLKDIHYVDIRTLLRPSRFQQWGHRSSHQGKKSRS